MPRSRTRGFTLIEMMIVLVVVAVLAAIALPSYRSYVLRANRSAAQQVMQDIANREEQYRLDARAYAGTWALLNGYAVPADVQVNYTISPPTVVAAGATATDCAGTASALSGPAYKITATAINQQVADGNLGDLCLDSNGNKAPTAKWQR